MTTATALLKRWFEGFGWPVYGENDVPPNTALPYITIPMKEPEPLTKATFYAELWAYTKANDQLAAKADEICAAVGVGVRIPCDSGLVVLWPETPQQQTIPEGNVRRIYLQFQLNSYICPGT